jgi:hypothetical protein
MAADDDGGPNQPSTVPSTNVSAALEFYRSNLNLT